MNNNWESGIRARRAKTDAELLKQFAAIRGILELHVAEKIDRTIAKRLSDRCDVFERALRARV